MDDTRKPDVLISQMTPHNDHEEALGAGLKYTEEIGRMQLSLPARDCWLWLDGIDAPISGLNIASFRQRFGAVSIPAEGIGGVETIPAFRRQGHMRTLLTKALERIAKRVPVVFVSDGIEDTYEQFGFVNCLIEATLTVSVRHVERMAQHYTRPPTDLVRDFLPEDLPGIVNLYNTAHAQRPWTHERHAQWNNLVPLETWKAGSEVIILERDNSIAGYAISKGALFGHRIRPVVVDEFTAVDQRAAHSLLQDIASRCWQMRLNTYQIREPLDSIVGQAARQLGCEYQQIYLPSGGMLGMILNRQHLLNLLEPELRRRLPSADLATRHTDTFTALHRGELIPDNRDLLRLLLGFWSIADLPSLPIPDTYRQIFDAWFPGGGASLLPMPYAHILDRY
jgi:GNAT superfamily N-acetyltransferase